MDREFGSFVWDIDKEAINIKKHGISFEKATLVFEDVHRKIISDEYHSQDEERYFCIGTVENKILTVRFIHREGRIRIYGAGYWRMGGKYYEEKH